MLPGVDTLTAAYFVAFIGGAAFSILSFLLASAGESGGEHGDAGAHAHGGHGLAHGDAHVHGHDGPGHDHGDASARAGLVPRALGPLLNLNALCAFMLVGGCVGFLSRHFFGAGVLTSALLAAPVGLGAAYLVGSFLRLLVKHSIEERPFDYEGTVATVTAAIRDDGVGEIVYLKDGARTSLPARADAPIVAGTEVIIVGLERGVARVAPSQKLLGMKEEE